MAGRRDQNELLIVEAGEAVDDPRVSDAESAELQGQPRRFRATRARAVIGALLACAVLAAMVLVGPQTAQRALAERVLATVRPVSLEETSAAMLDAVNEERRSEGLPSLCYNEKLSQAAQEHSDDMTSRDFMSHTGSDDSTPAQRVENAGYNWRVVAENVAKGQPTVADVMDSWMKSPGHKANILHTGIAHFGFAKSGVYWTQVFGQSRGDEVCIGAESIGAESGGGDEGDAEEAGTAEYQCCVFDSFGISLVCHPDRQWWIPWCPGEVEGHGGADESDGGSEEAEYQCCVFDNFGISLACHPDRQWWIPWCPGEVE